MNYEQLTMNYEQLTMNYEQLTMNYEQLTMNYEQRTMNYELKNKANSNPISKAKISFCAWRLLAGQLLIGPPQMCSAQHPDKNLGRAITKRIVDMENKKIVNFFRSNRLSARSILLDIEIIVADWRCGLSICCGDRGAGPFM
jgi:hypothetical protein